MNNHPLKVHYPYGGIHYMFHYWTYDERGHIILSKSLSGLKKIVKDIIGQNFDTRIKAFQKIDIIAPPKKLCEKASLFSREKEINDFVNEISYAIFYNFKKGRTLPIGLKKCNKYECLTNSKPDKWDRKAHFNCKNCFNKISFDSSKEEIYDKYYKAWENLFPSRNYKDDKCMYSLAKEADNIDILFRIKMDFGDHQNGLMILNVNEDVDYLCKSHTLFYFFKIEDLDYSEYIQHLKDLKDQKDKELELSKIEFKKHKSIENRNRLKQIRKIFKDINENQR